MAVDRSWHPEFHQTAIAGDARYRYVPFHDLSPEDQRRARGRYPHKAEGRYGFVDEHYLYPVRTSGQLASARRELAIPYALINDDGFMAGLGYEKRPMRR